MQLSYLDKGKQIRFHEKNCLESYCSSAHNVSIQEEGNKYVNMIEQALNSEDELDINKRSPKKDLKR